MQYNDHWGDQVLNIGELKFLLKELFNEWSHFNLFKLVSLSALPDLSEWSKLLFEVIRESSKAVSSKSEVIP